MAGVWALVTASRPEHGTGGTEHGGFSGGAQSPARAMSQRGKAPPNRLPSVRAGKRNPGEHADLLQVEAAFGFEVFGSPEKRKYEIGSVKRRASMQPSGAALEELEHVGFCASPASSSRPSLIRARFSAPRRGGVGEAIEEGPGGEPTRSRAHRVKMKAAAPAVSEREPGGHRNSQGIADSGAVNLKMPTQGRVRAGKPLVMALIPAESCRFHEGRAMPRKKQSPMRLRARACSMLATDQPEQRP